ncbi:MAG: M20/M25/M40 family metallo-hydrolase [Candidatus Saganbacteria bacterium]|nr:M20/M25/M40 family metallo-hydrolase [Candidatus Saganbacteria bacterium]
MSGFDDIKMEQIVKKLSFPRLTGSAGEAKAVGYCKKLFSEIGIVLFEDEFVATRFWFGSMLQLFSVRHIVAVIVSALFFLKYPYWNLVLIPFLAISYVLLLLFVLGAMGKRIPGKAILTRNLRARISAARVKKGDIILVGHHDSKSQTLTSFQRVLFYLISSISVTIALAIFFVSPLFLLLGLFSLPLVFKLIAYLSAIVAIMALIPLALNRLGNDSLGALDNASSVAVIYELARDLKKNPLNNYDVTILFTGAEELGMLGARAFVDKYIGQFSPGQTFVINFDMVGDNGCKMVSVLKTIRSGSGLLEKLAFDAAAKENLAIKSFFLLIGASTDSYIFSKKGYETIDFVSREASISTHGREDLPERFDGKIASGYCRTARGMMRKLDNL